MKKCLQKVTAMSFLLFTTVAQTQTVSTFENLTLNANSYWNGSSNPDAINYFSSGNAQFNNYYNSNFGGYWQEGWAYSNMKDSTTAGFSNMYSARTASGYNNSSNYAVAQDGAKIRLTGNALGKVVNGFYVTNTTYAAISMRDGDMFAKKFGGPSGNDPDWFKLTIKKWHNGVMTNDSVEFYLADFRFSNNTMDYILTTWQWVDLTPLGNVDSLLFTLSSSDVGQYGMNTPAFFAIDNFTTGNSALGLNEEDLPTVMVYPNPATDIIYVNVSATENYTLTIFDVTGKQILSLQNTQTHLTTISLDNFERGIYFVNVNVQGKNIYTQKIIKE